VDVRNEPECVGSDEHPGHDESREGRQLEAVEQQDDEEGDGEDHRQVLEDHVLIHGAPWYLVAE